MASFSPGSGRQSATPAGATGVVPAPGVVLFGRYRLDERLGQGGMAEVWRAHDEQLDRPVAVKLLHRHLLPDERSRERFAAEAGTAVGLAHPGIVTVHDVVVDGEQAAIVLELVDGEPLSELLARHGRLPEPAAAAITAQIAHAIQAAHDRGLVHRDVKPSNVLVSPDGRARLEDFGVARALDDRDSRFTPSGTIMGTLRYLAPEQLADGAADRATDVFGLGSLLYEMLVGRAPFPAATPAALMAQQRQGAPHVHGTSPELAGLARTALQHDAERRPRSAGSMAAMLERWLDNHDAFSADLPGITAAALFGGPVPRSGPVGRASAPWPLPDGAGVGAPQGPGVEPPAIAGMAAVPASPGGASAADASAPPASHPHGPAAVPPAGRSRRPIRPKHRAVDGAQLLFPSDPAAMPGHLPPPAGWRAVPSAADPASATHRATAGFGLPARTSLGPHAGVDPAVIAAPRPRSRVPLGFGRRRVPLISAVGLAGVLLAGLLLAGALAGLQAGSAPTRPPATPAQSAPAPATSTTGPRPSSAPVASSAATPAATAAPSGGQAPGTISPSDQKRRQNH